jgi:hypothetical protein
MIARMANEWRVLRKSEKDGKFWWWEEERLGEVGRGEFMLVQKGE